MSGLKLVFLANRSAIVRFAAARGAGAAEAEDLAQDLWLKIDAMPAVPVSEPRAYLYRMAANALLDRRRSGARRERRDEAWCGMRSGAVDIDERPSAEAELIAREQLRMVNDALDTLPERTRTIFRRFRVDGESQKDIAAELSVSISAVEKHLQRAYRVVVGTRLRLDAEARPARSLHAPMTR